MATADVTFVLEGTYPYVAGGVSVWVHQLLRAYPERTFALLHIAPRPGTYPKPVYELPANVVELRDVYCSGPLPGSRRPPRRSRTSAAG